MGSRTEGKNAPVALNTEDIALLANGPGSSRNGSVNNVADNPDISIPAKGRPESGDQVRRRLGVCLFLHIVGGSIIMQIYPKVLVACDVCGGGHSIKGMMQPARAKTGRKAKVQLRCGGICITYIPRCFRNSVLNGSTHTPTCFAGSAPKHPRPSCIPPS